MRVRPETQLRRAAAGTRGCGQAGRFPFRLLEVVACELGVQERELVFGHASRCWRGRAAGQMEVVEDFGDDGGDGEERQHAQEGGAFWANEGVDVERTFELVGPGVAVAFRWWHRRWRWVRCTFGL